jgi:hypothetical protein
MPFQIKSNKLTGLRPVFTDNLENYKRYIQIRKKFEADLYYRIFAEPKLDNFKNEAEWYTDWEGRVFTFDAFLAANPQVTKEELESSVKTEVNRLFAECAKYKDTDAEYRSLDETLQKCIEIPGYEDIYVILLPSGEQKYVLTNWGFINDAFNAQTGIIQKMKVMALMNLRVRFLYTNGTPAAGEKINAGYNQQSQEFTTDRNGDFVITRFPSNSSLSVHQFDENNQKVNAFAFNVVESDYLEVIIKNYHICDHTFAVQDDKGKTLPGTEIMFRVNGMDVTQRSDDKGIIVLKDVPLKAGVESYFMVAGRPNLINSFISNFNETKHILQIPQAWFPQVPPPVVDKNIVLHFIDKKKVNVTGLPVNLMFPAGPTETHTTDNDGKFTIKKPAIGSSLKLSANRDKIKWTGKMKCLADKDYYLFIFKKKSRWWLWLIFGLLLLLLLLLAGLLIKNCVRQGTNIYDTPDKRNSTEVVVLDDANNKPISGASVSLSCGTYSQQSTTGASGKVTFNQVPAASASQHLVVYVSKAGYGDERPEFELSQDKVTVRLKKLGSGGLVGKRGQFNVNLQWWTTDDLDLVITDPCGNMVYFKDKSQTCKGGTGILDVDANFKEDDLTTTPQENIVWEKASSGVYGINVVFYSKREKNSAKFKLTIFKGGKKEEINQTINYTGDKKIVLVKTISI